MFSKVCLLVESGLLMNPISAGLDPKWITELKIARFEFPLPSMEPIKDALLNPLNEFIKAALMRVSICKISFPEKIVASIS
jgi:hypothetical protein